MSATSSFAVQAQRALKQNNPDESIRLCREGLETFPEYVTAYIILTRAYMQLNDDINVHITLAKAKALAPSTPALVTLEREVYDWVPLRQSNMMVESKETINVAAQTVLNEVQPQHRMTEDISSPLAIITRALQETSATESLLSTQTANNKDDQDSHPQNFEVTDDIKTITPSVHNVSSLIDSTTDLSLNSVSIDIEDSIDENDQGALLINNIQNNVLPHNGEVEKVEIEKVVNENVETEDVEIENIENEYIDETHTSENVIDTTELSPIEDEPSIKAESDSIRAENQGSDDVVSPTVFTQFRIIDGTIFYDGEPPRDILLRRSTVPMRIIETAKADDNGYRTLRSTNLRLIPGLEYTPIRVELRRKILIQPKRLTSLPEPPPFPTIRGLRSHTTILPSFTVQSPVESLLGFEESIKARGLSYKLDQEESLKTSLPATHSGNTSMSQKDAVQTDGYEKVLEFGKPTFSHSNIDPDDTIITADSTPKVTAKKLTPLEELAARLERARIPAIIDEAHDEPLNKEPQEPMMISETMALIYEKQGALDEALKAYRLLAQVRPEKAEVYEKKMQDIEYKMTLIG